MQWKCSGTTALHMQWNHCTRLQVITANAAVTWMLFLLQQNKCKNYKQLMHHKKCIEIMQILETEICQKHIYYSAIFTIFQLQFFLLFTAISTFFHCNFYPFSNALFATFSMQKINVFHCILRKTRIFQKQKPTNFDFLQSEMHENLPLMSIWGL